MIALTEQASKAMLDALSALMDGGRVVLISETGRVLAELPLSDPAALVRSGGVLEFEVIEEGVASASGRANSASILGADGEEIFVCDVGDLNSDATVKLGTTDINHGNRVQISSFTLVLP